jgi:hypothetical protein
MDKWPRMASMSLQGFQSCSSCGFRSEGAYCPACGRALPRVPPDEVPEIAPGDADLEGPAYPQEAAPEKTASGAEFLAALYVLAGFFIVLAGAALAEPSVFKAGLWMLGLFALGYFAYKLYRLLSGLSGRF